MLGVVIDVPLFTHGGFWKFPIDNDKMYLVPLILYLDV